MRVAEHLVELDVRERLMPVRLDYEQVESLVKELGAQLTKSLGAEKLQSARYAAIPRGGHIVLGMLSYVLDLSPSAFDAPAPDDLLIVVDDCSVSGYRFKEYLANLRHEKIIFAHLCSAESLRRAILDQESKVRDCVAAMGLKDLSRELYPDAGEYQTWLAQCRPNRPDERYLYAVIQPVAFPWNEPDLNLQRHINKAPLDFWRLQPPDACLKNWTRLGLPPVSGLLPTLRCNPNIAHALVDDEVLLSDRRTRKSHRLRGLDADCWRALAAYGDCDAAVEWLATRHSIDPATLRRKLENFVLDNIELGIFQTIELRRTPHKAEQLRDSPL